jgi:uncharacterized membrane protein YkoI
MTRALTHIAVLASLFLGLAAGAPARASTGQVYDGEPPAAYEDSASDAAHAQLAPAYAQTYQYDTNATSSGGQMIPPSVALQVALNYAPGSQGLGVRLLQGARLMYAVKLKTGNRVHRVLVDAHTGQVLGE